MAKLLVKTEGINDPILELRLGVNRVGRSPENHLQIDHPTVSSVHCEIELSDRALVVRDCDSTNGLYVNGQRVRQAELQAGQTFLLGEVELLVETAEVAVAIPPHGEAPPAPPVVLPDGTTLCRRHKRAVVAYQCTHCHELLCDACVHHLRRKGGQMFHLCSLCSKPCRSLQAEAPKKQSLFEQFKQTVRVQLNRIRSPKE